MTVFPLLVFTGSITVKAHPSDVGVLELPAVRGWLENLPRVMTPDEALDVVLLADRPTTWT